MLDDHDQLWNACDELSRDRVCHGSSVTHFQPEPLRH